MFNNYKCNLTDLFLSFSKEHEILTDFGNLRIASDCFKIEDNIVCHNHLETLDNKDELYKKLEIFITLTEIIHKFSLFFCNFENSCNDLKTEFFCEKDLNKSLNILFQPSSGILNNCLKKCLFRKFRKQSNY